MEKNYGLVVFDSTSHALKAERMLKEAGVTCAVIPTPVEFTSGCGISLLVDEELLGEAERVLAGMEGHRFFHDRASGRGSG